jgi:hypothetical protein
MNPAVATPSALPRRLRARVLFDYLTFPARLLLRGHGRLLPRWLASLALPASVRPTVPWLTFGAIDYLAALDLAGRRVFEYGSGASTRYWLRRGVDLVSVEHDPGWYGQVRAALPPGAAVDFRLAPPEPAAPGSFDPADPAAYRSGSPDCSRLAFRSYAAQIDAFPDGAFDLVLVDGRARPSCLAHAIPKVRPGGMLILDNSERGYYTERLAGALAGFTPLVFPGPVPQAPVFSQTTIFLRRPPAAQASPAAPRLSVQ